MLITDVYKKYEIMPNLQIHQLRVASVASIICKNFIDQKIINSDEIIKSCLLHDMGNILKFDLTFFPEFTQPEGLEFWQEVKLNFGKKYGENEYIATQNIIKDLNQNDNILENSNKTGFSKAVEVLNSKNISWMICNYSDMRVGPHGILSLKERTEDGKKRYERNNSAGKKNTNFEEVIVALEEMEKQIFSICRILPSEINNETISKEISELQRYDINL